MGIASRVASMNILAFQQAAREYVTALDDRQGVIERCGRFETVDEAKAAFTAACDQEAAAFHALVLIVEAAVVDKVMGELVGKAMGKPSGRSTKGSG